MYCAVFICCTTAVTLCHSLLFVVTRCHSLYYSLSLFVTCYTTRCHSLSFPATCCTTRCHLLSFVVTRYHSLSLVVPRTVTRCHSLSLSFYTPSFLLLIEWKLIGEQQISVRILTEKKHPQMNLQRLQKVQIWAFGLLVLLVNKSTLYKRFLN